MQMQTYKPQLTYICKDFQHSRLYNNFCRKYYNPQKEIAVPLSVSASVIKAK